LPYNLLNGYSSTREVVTFRILYRGYEEIMKVDWPVDARAC